MLKRLDPVYLSDEKGLEWEGDDDPGNPHNWSLAKGAINAFVVIFLGLLSSFVSSIVVPAVPDILEEFRIHNKEVGTLATALFVLGLGIGPFLFAPLSELFGRIFVYRITMSVFTVLQVGCALSTSMPTLIVLRFFSGVFGSAPPSLGQATISDLFSRKDRAKWSAFYSCGPMIGPALGSMIASFIVSEKGWRWIFWVSACVSAGGTAFLFIISEETYSPVILQRRLHRSRKVEVQVPFYIRLVPDAIMASHSAEGLYANALSRPFRLLATNPTCAILGFYVAYVYGMLYLLLNSLPLLFRDGEGKLFSYNLSISQSGLCYLGLAVGFIIVSTCTAYFTTKLYIYLSEKNSEQRAEYRLLPMTVGMILLPIGLLLYGWSGEKHANIIVPIVGSAITAMGIYIAFQSIQVYLVDAFTPYSASAIAAATLLRSCAGCGLPLLGKQMFKALGYGWTSTILALAVLPAIPLPILLYKYAATLREKFPFNG